jgi:hypothetical protein
LRDDVIQTIDGLEHVTVDDLLRIQEQFESVGAA